jgi:serine/threonine-protein kinase
MAGSRWIPKLADFGIAKAEDWGDDTAIVAGTPMLLFSPLWAAPEQLTASKVTAATDVYSMALMVVFLLTGQFVFREKTPAPARDERKRARELAAVCFRGSPVPAAMVDVLRQALSLEPAGRPQTAGEFAAHLAAAAVGEWAAGSHAPPPLSPQSVRPRRVSPTEGDLLVAGRPLAFAIENGPTQLGEAGARFEIQHISRGVQGFVLQVRGRNCFVARQGGRPTSTVHLSASGSIELLTPARASLGRIHVDFGRIAAGHRVFDLASEAIAVGADDAKDAVAVHLANDSGYVIKGRA